MKKLLIFALVLALTVAMCACGGGEDTSGELFSAAESSKTESSVAESSVAEESEEISTENSSETEEEIQETIANFISIGTVDVKVNADSQNSIKLTGIDTELTEGSVVLFSEDADILADSEFSDFAIAVFEYSGEYFGYVMKRFNDIGENAVPEMPEDGFILAVHSSNDAIINKLKGLTDDVTVFPHGLHLYDGADYAITKAEAAPEIDGNFNEAEWTGHHIDDINAQNPSWSYAQFEVNNYYSTASYYTSYDDEYIYLCVVVDSPYHYCPISADKATEMYQYECIQVKVSSESPDSEYILTNFDHVVNNTAVNEGVVRSYGFAVNDNGETCYYEGGATTQFTGLAGCSRNDAEQLTVYEVAIPFAEFGITPEAGMKLGLTFSINSTNEDDVKNGIWKNITYRNGGGIIGRNDWSKIPVITLE